jgi:hypothetical protein
MSTIPAKFAVDDKGAISWHALPPGLALLGVVPPVWIYMVFTAPHEPHDGGVPYAVMVGLVFLLSLLISWSVAAVIFNRKRAFVDDAGTLLVTQGPVPWGFTLAFDRGEIIALRWRRNRRRRTLQSYFYSLEAVDSEGYDFTLARGFTDRSHPEWLAARLAERLGLQASTRAAERDVGTLFERRG